MIRLDFHITRRCSGTLTYNTAHGQRNATDHTNHTYW